MLFFFGFGISCVILYFTMWRDRDSVWSGWLPNDRVVKILRERPNGYSAKAKCKIQCFGITEKEIHDAIEKANVDFGASNTSSSPCKSYLVNFKLKKGDASGIFEICSDTVVSVSDINPSWKPDTACNCR